MAKEIIIPQGTYTVGIDFPEGKYIFEAENGAGMIDIYKNGNEDDNIYFHLNENQGSKCRIELKNGDYFVLDVQVKVTKAEMILFD